MSCLIAGFVGLTGPRLAAAAEGQVPLTAGDNGRKLPVKAGETIRFQLPTNARGGWTWEQVVDKDNPFGKPLNRYDAVPNSVLSTQDSSYVVQAPPGKPVKIRWIYCRFGRMIDADTGKTLVAQKPIQAGQDPQQGMTFELTLLPASPG